MKIVHICISNPYIDDWGYQENLLAEYLQKAGTQNAVIASANDFPIYLSSQKREEIMSKGSDYRIGEIQIKRIKTKQFTTSFLVPSGLCEALEELQPDAIFHHNFNCTSLPIAARYARKKNIPLMVDNHADVINMSRNKLWVLVYYKKLIRLTCKWHKNAIYKAYGVTHSRCDFIHDYYGLNRKKIDFLPTGADVDLADTIRPIPELRRKFNIGEDDFMVVSGGKMGKDKGTDNLIKAIEELHQEFPHIKLLLFGRFEDTETEKIARESQITILHDWCDRMKTLELLKLANVACWPIHHTSLIEDAVSVCTPIIIRKTSTTEHLINGNGIWLENGSKASLKDALQTLISQDERHRESLMHGCAEMKQNLSYHTIAQKVINALL